MITVREFITLASAIGTFALALAAFWNIFKPLKPKIKLSYGTTGEYLSKLEANCGSRSDLGVSCRYFIYRLKVENSKKLTSLYAKRVYLRFMEISKLNEESSWEELVPFNPFMMRWTSTTDANNIFYNDLGKGEYLYTNFFTVKSSLPPSNHEIIERSEILPGHEGIIDIALAAGFPREKLKENGKFRFKIGVFAENMKGNEFNYEVTFKASPNMYQTNINISEL
jgi:hypothetical protein